MKSLGDPEREASIAKHPRNTILSGPISRTGWVWVDVEGEIDVQAIDQLLEMIVLVRDTFRLEPDAS